jgi:RimJ/RimL family protein N-acetyltransferase
VTRLNEFGHPIGEGLGLWKPPGMILRVVLEGDHVRLIPLEPSHAPSVYPSLRDADDLWTYMPFGPFPTADDLEAEFRDVITRSDWRAYAIETGDGLVGFLSYLRIAPHDGAIEIGAIVYSHQLQRTTAATEAQYLLLNQAFDSGYRRVEWKCDDLNEPSRRAAVRLGYLYEGTFRMATHYKGRSRDTAWYAITIDRWPQVKRSFEAWLAPDNFDNDGNQITTLSNLTT